VSVLSRTAKLGIAPESVPGVYELPAFPIVFSSGAKYRQVITPLRDKALRGSDSELQDLLQGPVWSEWVIPSDLYPDLIGFWLASVIGPDTCTPGISTTLTASASAGAQAVSLAAQPAAGAVLMLGSGAALEYAQAGTPSGSGPYTVPLETPLRFAHPDGDSAVSQSTHVFAQNQEGPTFSWPRWSLTMDDGTGPLGWPGTVVSSLQVKIGSDGMAKLTASASGFPPSSVSTFAWEGTPAQPMYGWQWQITTGGGASTRGQQMDLTLHREVGVCPVIGSQVPLGIWPGPLQADGTYTAIFEDDDDFSQFTGGIQDPVVHTLVQPVLAGGCSVTLTMPRSGWLTGEPVTEGVYLAATFQLSGIAQPAGGGLFTATLSNYWPNAYA
jgi:Phage tail tube protein